MQADDDELLRRIAGGDEDAVSTFYSRHLDTVLAYVRGRISDADLVFDLTAETFAAVIGSAHRYRPGTKPAVAWLLGIARNKTLESLRRGRTESAARDRLRFEPIVLDDADLQSVEERASRGAGDLARLLSNLPSAQRAALEARIVDERPYAEIARELKCSEQVVRQRVHRALDRLRKDMEEAHDGV